MAETEFTKGSIVRLKSGGELMTIDNFAYDEANQTAFTNRVVCVWFEGKKFQSKIFNTSSLVLVE